MGDKKRRTVTLDAENDEVLSNDKNASATVNALIEEYKYIGRSREAALSYQISEKEAELKQARQERARVESKIDKLEREIESLRESMHGLTDEEQHQIMKVVELIENGEQVNWTKDDLSTDNELIQKRSDKCGMKAERFIREVRERL